MLCRVAQVLRSYVFVSVAFHVYALLTLPYVFHLCFTYLSLMSRLCGTHVSPLFQS